MEHIEESDQLTLDFNKLNALVNSSIKQVLPVIVQHADTKEVLILAYVSQETLKESIETGIVTFWSTSRNERWVKGATSGDYLILKEVRVNCEQNSLLFLVIPKNNGVCHSKDALGDARRTCFYRKVNASKLEFLF